MLCNEMYPGLYEPFRVEKYTAQLLNDDDQVYPTWGLSRTVCSLLLLMRVLNRRRG